MENFNKTPKSFDANLEKRRKYEVRICMPKEPNGIDYSAMDMTEDFMFIEDYQDRVDKAINPRDNFHNKN